MSAAPPPLDRVRPSPANPRGSFLATVKENRRLCTDHYRLIFTLPRFPKSVPGQFVQIDCRDPHLASDAPSHTLEVSPTQKTPHPTDPDFVAPLAFLRRPFSIADHRILSDGSSEIDIIHRVVGKGTRFLAHLQPEQSVSILGPLGHGFQVPDNLQLACLVGGGVGIPPILYLARTLRERAGGSNALAFIGTQREDLLPVTLTDLASTHERSAGCDLLMNVKEFADHGYPAIISTDDGSRGMKGFITAALDQFLHSRLALTATDHGPLTTDGTIIYCCGPTPMMKATAKVAARHGVICQLSLEQPMACGMATCQSCIIKFRPHDAPPGTDWKYKLTCTEGPVFDSRDIVW